MDEVVIRTSIAIAFDDYEAARSARASWAAEEKRLKEIILEALGYDDDDPKPVPVVAVAPSGVPIFKVTVGSWKGLDVQYLKANFPDVYATCERNRPTKAIKQA